MAVTNVDVVITLLGPLAATTGISSIMVIEASTSPYPHHLGVQLLLVGKPSEHCQVVATRRQGPSAGIKIGNTVRTKPTCRSNDVE